MQVRITDGLWASGSRLGRAMPYPGIMENKGDRDGDMAAKTPHDDHPQCYLCTSSLCISPFPNGTIIHPRVCTFYRIIARPWHDDRETPHKFQVHNTHPISMVQSDYYLSTRSGTWPSKAFDNSRSTASDGSDWMTRRTNVQHLGICAPTVCRTMSRKPHASYMCGTKDSLCRRWISEGCMAEGLIHFICSIDDTHAVSRLECSPATVVPEFGLRLLR